MREGAGCKPVVILSNNRALITDDPVKFMRALMRDPKIPMKQRAEAARDLLDFEREARVAQRPTKKAAVAEASERAVKGRYAPMKPPSSVVLFRRRGEGDAA